MAAVTELATEVGTRAACRALFAPRASHYRNKRALLCPAVTSSRPASPRALAAAERQTVLAHLHGERFQDRSPAAVYATLLDEGGISLLDPHHVSPTPTQRRIARASQSVDPSSVQKA